MNLLFVWPHLADSDTLHVGFVCGGLSADKDTYFGAVRLKFKSSIKCNM